MKIRIKFPGFPAALALFCVLAATPVHAEIYRSVSRDGTVEYHNRESVKPAGKRQRITSRFDTLIKKIALARGVDPYLVTCVIRVESNFDPDAVSTSGAMGLMQIMQGTARCYNMRDPLDPEENIRVGTAHLASLLRHFKNDVPLALAAYHAGLGRVKGGRIPPIRSTIDYVNRVMFLYRGVKDSSERVKRLYKKIDKDGTILIYSR